MPNRRQCLQVGGLTALGLTLPDLFRLRAATAAATPAAKHRGNSCVFLFLFGGPSHIDLWDMKPKAPAEIRGEFTPVATTVPGIDFCEHLPRLSKTADKLCLLRSMTHGMNVHGPACSEVFSGRPYFGPPVTDQARPEDWPSLSAMTTRFGLSPQGLPPAIVLPWHLQFPGQSLRIAGQTGGRMGEQYNPMLLEAEAGRFQLGGLSLQEDVPWQRVVDRRELLGTIEARRARPSGAIVSEFERHSARVYSLLENRMHDVLDLERETAAVRGNYGPTAIGQSLLMARRLVEAGVPLVSVNWEDETKIDGVNTCWDTHQENFAKLKTLLCPIFDQVFPAFINDLAERGLLETTLVVAIGEFGRTPKLGQFTQSSNTKAGGRDHWPHAFTAILAGGGVRGGQVYGATTPTAGYVAEQPVSPADLTATILHHLGIDPSIEYDDGFQRMRQALSEGTPVEGLG